MGEGEEPARIRVLGAELADQIAAGEVVERPASVVKELVENAIDAGARRVEVELEAAGLDRIVVVDDGRGIHRDDLRLAITRHATSKLRRGDELLDVGTLGFRGEALASIAAVAQLILDSRRVGTEAGTRLRSRPGLAAELEPVGMPVGTRIEVLRLFANVPARRKFMRAEATEVGHCSEAMLRLGLSHPGVHLRLRHGGRELVDLAPASLPDRIEQVLRRRTTAPLRRIEGEHDGIRVDALLASDAARSRGGLYVIVRRRVVHERSLAQIVSAALGETLPAGTHAVGCLVVEPPPKTVDVNVHPQKAEVRFSDPQRVYAAVRQVLAGASAMERESVVRRFGGGVSAALDGWAARDEPIESDRYRLRTHAVGDGYAEYRGRVRDAVDQLRDPRSFPGSESESESGSESESESESESDPASVVLLSCLPGPIAILRHRDDLLAVDLRVLRSHLLYRRLVDELGGSGVAAQGLLQPVVVERPPADVRLCAERADDLAAIGLVLEPFGDDALLVRAVPAHLRACVEDPDVARLVASILPWLRMAAPARDDALRVMASTPGTDPAPRLARRWLRELIDEGADLDKVPGIRRFTPADLRSNQS